jgi:hypothetical protein
MLTGAVMEVQRLYIDHVQTHIEQPEYWAEDYYAFSHGVPQLGVYAIARSYE